jgi:hypothetical protein
VTERDGRRAAEQHAERIRWRKPIAAETHTGRCRTDVERLADRLNTPVQATRAHGLKLALAPSWWASRWLCQITLMIVFLHDADLYAVATLIV